MAANVTFLTFVLSQRIQKTVNIDNGFILKRVTCLRVTRFCFLSLALCFYSVTASLAAEKQEALKAPVNITAKATYSKSISSNTKKIDAALNFIQAIAQAGAYHLALSRLDKQQPSYTDDPLRWLIWERERISLLTLSKQYKKLVSRVDIIPLGVNEAFLFWAKTQQATAYLTLKQYADARQSLLNLIWNTKKTELEFNNKWLPHWRRIIIHSYLSENSVKDAHIAITRFRQDYGEGDLSDIVLYARVLLMNNLNDEALTVLSKYTHQPDAGMLHLLAQLRKDTRSPRKVLQAALRQMQGDWVKPELKIYLWSIVAEAAQRSEDKLAAIKAMEYIFSNNQTVNISKRLFKLTIDDLWKAYSDNAMQIGNKAQYLVGDDAVWLEAGQAFEATQVINAHSLYAFLILHGQNKKEMAVSLFMKSLLENDNGRELINQLFLHSSQFKTKQSIPISVRHLLVDYALSKADIRLASELMASIKTSPQGADQFTWGLRRARVLVMGGNAEESTNTLLHLLAESKDLKINDIDKLMQVIFDLQTVNEHKKAYRVFEAVLPVVDDSQRKREVYYWMADSKNAQKMYAEAANLYLKSAMLPDNEENQDATFDISLDPWGQTARYQAAKSLAKAGLVSDARALYTHLLKVTKEESRLKVLKHELQQLWLLENKTSNQ